MDAGSSPRMWGLRYKRFYGSCKRSVHPHACGVYRGILLSNEPHVRFIPTHVGFTALRWSSATPPTVHPHACGVYPGCISLQTHWCGSSPRMWGLRGHGLVSLHNGRFIPTHVGFTIEAGAACGQLSGSSPRMWGLRFGLNSSTLGSRFIPTHVGFTPA